MSSYLITGATGYIGQHVVRHMLDAGQVVVATGRSISPFPSHKNLTYHQIDLHDAKAVSAFFETYELSHLIHLAWEATPGKFWHSLDNFDWVSTSARLLDLFVKKGGKKAVLAGTCAEYKWDNSLLNEDCSILAPTTYYSSSKWAFKEIADVIGKDIDLVWGRVFFPYGPDEAASKLISYIFEEISHDRMPVIQAPNRAVDYIHIEDVAAAFSHLVLGDATGVVNICSGNALLPYEVVFECANLLKKKMLLPQLQKAVFEANKEIVVCGDVVKLASVMDLSEMKTLKEGLGTYLKCLL